MSRVGVSLPPCDAAALQRRLAERDEHRVEVPIIERGGRQWWVRVSVQGYNTREDAEALVVGPGALIQEVHGRKGWAA